MPENDKTEILEVESLTHFNSEVFKVCLRLPKNSSFNFTAGQYLQLVVNDQDNRSFSIASAPEALPYIELHIRQMLDNEFTQQVIHQLQQSKHIAITGPFGRTVVLKPIKRPISFIVGGTGFAPAKAMMESLLDSSLDTKIHLFWGARTAEELYLDELPQSWQRKQAAFDYTPVIFEPDTNWQGATGLVHKVAMEKLADELHKQDIYIAGSREMVLAVYKDLLAAGVPRQQIHSDILDILRDQGELLVE